MSLFENLGGDVTHEAALSFEDVKALRGMMTTNSPLWNFMRIVQITAIRQRLTVSEINFSTPTAAIEAADAKGKATGLIKVIELLDELLKEKNDVPANQPV